MGGGGRERIGVGVVELIEAFCRTVCGYEFEISFGNMVFGGKVDDKSGVRVDLSIDFLF